MAVKHLGAIADELIKGGRGPDQEVTIISHATLPVQLVQQTTLAGAAHFLSHNEAPTPAIVVVGNISPWRKQIDWYTGALRENGIG